MKKTLISLMVATLIILMCAACQNQEITVICGNCATRVPESSKYCSGCGAQLFLNQDGTNPADSNQSSTANTDGGAVVGDPTTETIFPDTPPTTEPPSTEPPHSHNYTSKITTNPTCTDKGYTTYTCTCGHTYTGNPTEAKGHSWIDATCTTAKTCSRCNEAEGIALGHMWVDASCDTPKTCTVCKETEGSVLGHSWEPATKTTPKTCSVCKQIDQQDEITKNWFVNQYNLAQTQYINSLERSKLSKQDDIADLKADIDYELDKYTQKRIDILNRYPPSETRDVMLTNAQQNYAAAIRPYKDKISRLESEIATIDAEIANPSVDSILSIVANTCNISSQQAYQYYSQYKNCIQITT